jgi:hypothetical protein
MGMGGSSVAGRAGDTEAPLRPGDALDGQNPSAELERTAAAADGMHRRGRQRCGGARSDTKKAAKAA